MKPKEKVVSAQDVQSSLYYCHLASEDDDVLLQDSPQEQVNSEFATNGFNINSAKDHQAGATEPAAYRTSRQSENLPTLTNTSVDQPSLRNEHQIRRKPVVGQNFQDYPTPIHTQTRRILGPRPLVNRSGSSASGIPKGIIEANSTSSNTAIEQASYPILAPSGNIGLPASSEGLSSNSSSVLLSNKYITLIRRDPATEDQWNIGNLSLSVPRSLQARNHNARRHNKDVLIKLSTAGYTKFVDPSNSTVTDVFERELTLSTVSDAKNGPQPVSISASAKHPPLAFLTPWRTPCTFQTAATGRALKCYHSFSGSLAKASAEIKYDNGTQAALVSELRFNLPSLFERSSAKKKENRRPISFQQYSNSKHDFLRGGRSPSPDKPADMAVSGRGTITDKPLQPEQSLLIQSSSFHHRARSTEVTSKYRSNPEDNAEDFEDESDTQLDLLLGQERAGGGFSGNKAKLGKLIIYGGQGLAMLDLLVAANMAIWFRDILKQ